MGGICQIQQEVIDDFIKDRINKGIHVLTIPQLMKKISTQGKKPTKIDDLEKQLQEYQNLLTHPTQKNHHKDKSGQQFQQHNNDLRKKVQNTAKWPFSAIGLIKSDIGYGTGTLVSKNIVLTSASNVYNRKTKRQVNKQSILFMPGIHGETYKTSYKVKQVFYPPQFQNDNVVNQYLDIALLELFESLQEVHGYVGLYTEYKKKANEQLLLYGYPTQKVDQYSDEKLMFGMSGRFQIDQKFVKYKDIYTSSGQNGSALLIKDQNGDYLAIGVHTTDSQEYNYGVYLRNELKIMINSWTKLIQRSIDLEGWKEAGPKICRYLRDQILENMIKVNLSDCSIGDEGCRFLKDANWSTLKHLILKNNGITSKGCQYLQQGRWSKLVSIDLSGNRIDEKGISLIKEAWPHAQIKH